MTAALIAGQRITLENAVMGWSLHAIPLHLSVNDDVLEWAASARFSRGVPDQPSEPESLPSVAQVLAVFAAAQCHGTAWFALCDSGASPALAPCPDPSAGVPARGLDLGEVSLHLMGQDQVASEVRSDALVEALAAWHDDGVGSMRHVSARQAKRPLAKQTTAAPPRGGASPDRTPSRIAFKNARLLRRVCSGWRLVTPTARIAAILGRARQAPSPVAEHLLGVDGEGAGAVGGLFFQGLPGRRVQTENVE